MRGAALRSEQTVQNPAPVFAVSLDEEQEVENAEAMPEAPALLPSSSTAARSSDGPGPEEIRGIIAEVALVQPSGSPDVLALAVAPVIPTPPVVDTPRGRRVWYHTLPDKHRLMLDHSRSTIRVGPSASDTGINNAAWALMSHPEKSACILETLSKHNSAPGGGLAGSSGDAAPAPGPVNPRTIIEFCCEEDSRIGETAPPGCAVQRLTKRDKVESRAGFKKCSQLISRANTPTLLWGSMPCTGGCAYSHVNLSRGGSAAEKVMAERDLFDGIWHSFEKAAKAAAAKG